MDPASGRPCLLPVDVVVRIMAASQEQRRQAQYPPTHDNIPSLYYLNEYCRLIEASPHVFANGSVLTWPSRNR